MSEPAPPDLVGPIGLTREVVDLFDRAAGRPVEVSVPGEVEVDGDGLPAWVAPPTRSTAILASLTITRGQADALGIDSDTHPNVTIDEE